MAGEGCTGCVFCGVKGMYPGVGASGEGTIMVFKNLGKASIKSWCAARGIALQQDSVFIREFGSAYLEYTHCVNGTHKCGEKEKFNPFPKCANPTCDPYFSIISKNDPIKFNPSTFQDRFD